MRMRFSTGSSSSSLASDSLSRKSTFCIYTEDPPSIPHEKMDSGSETMELRRELDAVRSALHVQSEAVLTQRHRLVEASAALAARDRRAAREQRLRRDQLALVLRSLFLLESRLARDQKQIGTVLQQKDELIRSQKQEIASLKSRQVYCAGCRQALGFASEQTNIETDPEFHSLESTDSRFQLLRSCSYSERVPAFQKNTRLSKSFQLPKHDVACGNTSSSEEGHVAVAKGTYVKNKQAFVRKDVTRRSRKYSGRKQNNAYLENLKKRTSSSAEECVAMGYDVNRSDAGVASESTDRLVENEAVADSEKAFAFNMEKMHGTERQGSNEINANRASFLNKVLGECGERPWYANVSDPEPEETHRPVRGADRLRELDGALHAEVVSAKNQVLCGSVRRVTRDRFGQMKRLDDDKGCGDSWYASASDADDAPVAEIYRHNPVLECVNQILLQNSLDESGHDTSKSSDAPSPKPAAKRVQFSTLNSISFDESVAARPLDRRNKVVKFSLETASEHSYEVPDTAQGYNYEIQSIYSNDYEPIGTKAEARPVPLPRTLPAAPAALPAAPLARTSVRHIAAHIESRSAPRPDETATKMVNRRKVPRTPPALPPKPKNLSKFKFDNTTVRQTDDSDAVGTNQRIAEVTKATEPDYCSISEINVPVVGSGQRELLLSQPTVEIHSEQYPDRVARVVSLQRIRSDSETDIPMLPQVTEIIIPEEEESSTGRHPIASSPPELDRRSSIQMCDTVCGILSEIKRAASAEKLILTELDRQFKSEQKGSEEAFDLSQNFEEFKIDECDLGSMSGAEEYRISSDSSTASDLATDTVVPDTNDIQKDKVVDHYRVEIVNTPPKDEATLEGRKTRSRLSNKPDLLSNIELESESSNSSSNSGSYNTVKMEPLRPNGVAFDMFLESSGLSSKAILPRVAPKFAHLKLRIDKPMTTAIKYFEPYL